METLKWLIRFAHYAHAVLLVYGSDEFKARRLRHTVDLSSGLRGRTGMTRLHFLFFDSDSGAVLDMSDGG